MTPRETEIGLEVAELDRQLSALASEQSALRHKRDELLDVFRKETAFVQPDEQFINKLGEIVIISFIRVQYLDDILQRTYALRKPRCSYYDTVSEEVLQTHINTGELRKYVPKEWALPASMKLKHIQLLSEDSSTWLCFTAAKRMIKITSSEHSSAWEWEELVKMDPKYDYFLCRNFKYDEYYIRKHRKHVKGEYHGRSTHANQHMVSVRLLAVGKTKADMLEHLI